MLRILNYRFPTAVPIQSNLNNLKLTNTDIKNNDNMPSY